MSGNEIIPNKDLAPPYENYNPFLPDNRSSSKIENPLLPKTVNEINRNPFFPDSEPTSQINSNKNNPFLPQGNKQENSDCNKKITIMEKNIKYENNKIIINKEKDNLFGKETINNDVNKEVDNIFLCQTSTFKTNQSIPKSNEIIFSSPKELNYTSILSSNATFGIKNSSSLNNKEYESNINDSKEKSSVQEYIFLKNGFLSQKEKSFQSSLDQNSLNFGYRGDNENKNIFNLNSNEVKFGFKSDEDNKNELINNENKITESNIKENNKINYNPFLLNGNNGKENESSNYSFTKNINNNNNIGIKNEQEKTEEFIPKPFTSLNDIIKKEEIKPNNINPFLSINESNSNSNPFSFKPISTSNLDTNNDNKRKQCENDIKEFISHSYNPFLSHNENKPNDNKNNPFLSQNNNNKSNYNNYNPFLSLNGDNKNNKDTLSQNNNNESNGNNINPFLINKDSSSNKNCNSEQNNDHKEENGNPFNLQNDYKINNMNPLLSNNNIKNDNIKEKNESQTYNVYNSIQNLEKLDIELNAQNNELNKEIKPLNFSNISNSYNITENQNKEEIIFSKIIPEQRVQKDETIEIKKTELLHELENFNKFQEQNSKTASDPSFLGDGPANKNTKLNVFENKHKENEISNNDGGYKLEDSPIKNDNQRKDIEINNLGTFSLGNSNYKSKTNSEIQSKELSINKEEEKINQIQYSENIPDNNQIQKKLDNKNINKINSFEQLSKGDLPTINNIIEINEDGTNNENKEISLE